MSKPLSSSTNISFNGVNGNIINIFTEKAIINTAVIDKIINPQLVCLEKIVSSMYDVSGCQIVGLNDQFKQLICDAVNNYCPYYCTDCVGNIRGINLNNVNSSDNDNSFFREELLSNSNFLNDNFSVIDTEENDSDNDKKISNDYNFVTKNLSSDELLVNNNLKIITIEKINKGIWLFNGNISIKIPKQTQMTNLKLFIYLDENIIPSGEIDLGSQIISDFDVIMSFPYNLMFNNDLSKRELKVALISFDNSNSIILLKSTNFFLKMI